MRHIRINVYDAPLTQAPFAPMRRIAQGVIGGDARAHDIGDHRPGKAGCATRPEPAAPATP